MVWTPDTAAFVPLMISCGQKRWSLSGQLPPHVSSWDIYTWCASLNQACNQPRTNQLHVIFGKWNSFSPVGMTLTYIYFYHKDKVDILWNTGVLIDIFQLKWTEIYSRNNPSYWGDNVNLVQSSVVRDLRGEGVGGCGWGVEEGEGFFMHLCTERNYPPLLLVIYTLDDGNPFFHDPSWTDKMQTHYIFQYIVYIFFMTLPKYVYCFYYPPIQSYFSDPRGQDTWTIPTPHF